MVRYLLTILLMLLTFSSAILNTQSRYYEQLKGFLAQDFEDNYWAEDSIFLERNSRDFVPRIEKMNVNAEAVCNLLQPHPKGMYTKSTVCFNAGTNSLQ